MAVPELTPDPGVVLERVYFGLPEHYRTADEGQGFPLYRWLAGVCGVMSEVEELRERIDWVVPADRLEPWVPGTPATNQITSPEGIGSWMGRWHGGGAGTGGYTDEVGETPVGNHFKRKFWTVSGTTNGDTGFNVYGPKADTPNNGTWAVVAGETWTLKGYLRASAARGRKGTAGLYWYDATGALLSRSQGADVPFLDDEWIPVSHTAVAPPNAVAASGVLDVIAAGVLWEPGEYLDGTGAIASLGDGDTVEYFTGDTENDRDYTYGWTELPHQSPSFRTARLDDTSDLGDPTTADAAWLPWMAQLVGVDLNPDLTPTQARDAVRYASAGWRAGTRSAVADAARSELTGTKYAAVYDHSISGIGNGGVWDVLVVTRPTETPDPNAVLAAIVAKGAKPAGVVLHHRSFESTWDTVVAVNPTWADYTETWDQIQEAGF